jgi:hypothetical protein
MSKKHAFKAMIENASEAVGGATFVSAIINSVKGRTT